MFLTRSYQFLPLCMVSRLIFFLISLIFYSLSFCFKFQLVQKVVLDCSTLQQLMDNLYKPSYAQCPTELPLEHITFQRLLQTSFPLIITNSFEGWALSSLLFPCTVREWRHRPLWSQENWCNLGLNAGSDANTLVLAEIFYCLSS